MKAHPRSLPSFEAFRGSPKDRGGSAFVEVRGHYKETRKTKQNKTKQKTLSVPTQSWEMRNGTSFFLASLLER